MAYEQQNPNGQATMANSSPVVIASNQTAVLVDGSASTQPVSGTVTVTQGTGTNLHTVIDSGAVTVSQSTASSLNATVVGTGTFATQATLQTGSAIVGRVGIDQTTPGTTNKVYIGTDGTVAIGTALPAGTNAIGKLAANSGVDIGDVDVTSVIPGTGATNLGKAEDAGHTTGDTGVMILGVRNDALAALSGTDLDYTPIATDSTGRVMMSWAPTAAMVRGTATTTGTSDTSLIAASGSASLKTYIKSVQIVNKGSTTALITFKDGNAGSTLGYSIAPTGGGSNIVFEIPLVTSANTAFYFAAGSASTTIYVSAQGFLAP